MLDNPATAAVVGAGLIFLAGAVGAAAGLLWIMPREHAGEHASLPRLRAALWRLLGLGLILFFAAGLVELLLRTATMSDQPLSQAYTELGTVLSKTHYGHAWLWRYAALLIAGLAWLWGLVRGPSRAAAAFAFTALAAAVLAVSTAGHAGDDGFFAVTNFANTLHILGGLLWGGGIVATMLLILPRLIRENAPREAAAMASLRLSTVAAVALAMVIIPGVYNAWLLIGSWHGLWATPYGQVLIAKLLLVALMAGLGALNRFRYVPAMQRYAGLAEPRTLFPLPRFLRGGDKAPPRSFLASLRFEGALLIAVLLLAAVLSQQVPAVHAEHEGMDMNMDM